MKLHAYVLLGVSNLLSFVYRSDTFAFAYTQGAIIRRVKSTVTKTLEYCRFQMIRSKQICSLKIPGYIRRYYLKFQKYWKSSLPIQLKW